MNDEIYGFNYHLHYGFGVRVAYLSAPAVGGAARRPILPIRQEALVDELPTKAEVIEDLTWGLTSAVTRWGVNYGPKTEGDVACDAVWGQLAKQLKKSSGRVLEAVRKHRNLEPVNPLVA